MCPLAVDRRLRDYKKVHERWAARRAERLRLPEAYGNFIAGVELWDWFINPITFRDDWRGAHRSSSHANTQTGPPCSEEAMSYIKRYFADMQKMAARPVGWMVAEEFGVLAGRFHCHALVTGVWELPRSFWWKEAFRRFGRTRIEPFDPRRAAAFYAAKYAAKALGAIHFGGTLAGIDLSLLEEPCSVGEGQDLTTSAELPKGFFRMGLNRWHR